MAALRLLILAPTLIYVLSGCSAATDDPNTPASTQAAAGEVGGTGGEGPNDAVAANGAQAGGAGRKGSQGKAGQTSRTNDDRTGTNEDSANPDSGNAESGGAANANSGGAGSSTDPVTTEPPPPPSCDLDGSCIKDDCKDTTVACGVESTGTTCEFEGFKGATAPVSCGQRAVIGMACCGGCGCVPVEVYFDGTHCWQGFPQCEMEEFRNKMVLPHLPTTPNPSYTPPDPAVFYFGSGGFGGTGAAGGAAATSSGGSGTGGAPDLVAGAHSIPEAGQGGVL